MNKPQISGKGGCHGVNLVHRAKDDTHALVQIFTEDDSTWNSEMLFSSYWLPDLINTLQAVQNKLERVGVVDERFGYRLPHKEVVAQVEQIFSEEGL